MLLAAVKKYLKYYNDIKTILKLNIYLVYSVEEVKSTI